MKHTDLPGARVFFTEVGAGTDPYRDNYGAHVPDDPRLVEERRFGLFTEIGAPIVWMNQTHSTVVEVIARGEQGPVLARSGVALGRPATGEWGPVEADGVVIDAREWRGGPALAVQTADCLPVVLSAADGRVVAAVHAGRRGLLGGILGEAVAALRARTDGPIEALIGPAICGSCYEVPEQMASESESSMPGIRTRTSWGTPSLDLPAAAAASLSALGVRVVTDPRCTLEDQALFSYRRDSGCGRQALVIVPV